MAILSEDYVRRLALGSRSELVIRDARLPGFGIRLRRRADGSLSKMFFVVHEIPAPDGQRKRRKVMIGDHAIFPADRARLEALAMLQAVKVGDDPAAARAAKKAQPLFEDLVEIYDEQHIAEKKPATQKDYRARIRRTLMPAFKGKRVAEITLTMVRDLHRKKRANPVEANRALAVLSSMMSHAITLSWRTDNPCKGARRNFEAPREAWLDEQRLPLFLASLAAVDGVHADCIRFLTVTGWRVSEALTLTWNMVDLPRLVARLPETKTGVSVRALATDAATILDAQSHRIGFCFSSGRGARGLSYKRLREVLLDVCTKAGIEPITPHVLRHTAATWAAINGAEAHELREAFGWRSLAMTARYVSRSESLGRRGAQRAADAMNVLQRAAAEVVAIVPLRDR